MNPQQIKEELEQFLKSTQDQLSQCDDLVGLQNVKSESLGKKSPLTQILKNLGQLTPDERKQVGEFTNVIKEKLALIVEDREVFLKKKHVQQKIENERVDVTLPPLKSPMGRLHPITQIYEHACGIFKSLGFAVAEGPEIESDYYNFEALNFPQDHPARDMQDTFYLSDGRLLRAHTSPVQIRVMEDTKPPIAIVAPGTVYRCDSDQTHTPMFHQIEGLMIDRDIHFGHLKAIVQEFLERLFETKLTFRFRPSFFPFTEPSAEVDMSCHFCSQKGCRICKGTGWIEIAGCGMVHPNVLKAGNIDSEIYSGFAFGVGLERLAMLLYGVNDLRSFFENDVRFLKQFKVGL